MSSLSTMRKQRTQSCASFHSCCVFIVAILWLWLRPLSPYLMSLWLLNHFFPFVCHVTWVWGVVTTISSCFIIGTLSILSFNESRARWRQEVKIIMGEAMTGQSKGHEGERLIYVRSTEVVSIRGRMDCCFEPSLLLHTGRGVYAVGGMAFFKICPPKAENENQHGGCKNKRTRDVLILYTVVTRVFSLWRAWFHRDIIIRSPESARAKDLNKVSSGSTDHHRHQHSPQT